MNKFILSLMMMLCLLSGIRAQGYNTTGLASYCVDKVEGRQSANGKIYRHSKLLTAHPSLPFSNILKVTNLKNGKTVVFKTLTSESRNFLNSKESNIFVFTTKTIYIWDSSGKTKYQ